MLHHSQIGFVLMAGEKDGGDLQNFGSWGDSK